MTSLKALKRKEALREGYMVKGKPLKKHSPQVMLVIGVIFIALNLRPALTSIGPIMGFIRDELGFSNWNVALLTSLPLLVFAIMSIATSYLSQRFTNEKTLLFGLFILTIGIVLRSTSMMFFLFFGTLCIGVGIAICNVLLPGIIKDSFPNKLSLMTGLYSTSMAISATMASAISVPFAESWGLGWRISLLVWAIPAFFALLYWLFIHMYRIKPKASDNKSQKAGISSIAKSPLAWFIALFMGCQSLLFYITISWFPEILVYFGTNQKTAGFLLSYLQLIGILSSLLVPIISGKLKSQVWMVIGLNIFLIIGILMLLFYQNILIFIISTTLIGFSLSGNFTLALLFLSMRTNGTKQSTFLSGMAQSIGYALAAIGPMAIGSIYDITQQWTVPLLILIVLAIFSSLLGLKVGKNELI